MNLFIEVTQCPTLLVETGWFHCAVSTDVKALPALSFFRTFPIPTLQDVQLSILPKVMIFLPEMLTQARIIRLVDILAPLDPPN